MRFLNVLTFNETVSNKCLVTVSSGTVNAKQFRGKYPKFYIASDHRLTEHLVATLSNKVLTFL